MFIKFCGFTREEDVRGFLELKTVNAAGYIFYEKSKRYITPERAGRLSEIIDDYNDASVSRKILKTGIFVDKTADEILETAETAGLDIIQFYDPEIAEYLQKHYPVFFSLRVKDSSVLNDLPVLNDRSFYLLDAYNENDAGGSGICFDWSVLDGFPGLRRTILAGGINAGNIRQALNIPGIYGIDLSSGIEDAPGQKSLIKMKQLDSAIMEVLNG